MLGTWLAVGALVVVGLAGAVVAVGRRTSGTRLAALLSDADPSLRECRAWNERVDRALAEATAQGRWVTRDRRLEWESTRPRPSAALERLARRGEDGRVAREALTAVHRDLARAAAEVDAVVLRAELVACRPFLDSIEKQPLTDEQATAVVTMDNRVQVVASAGSGKTSVMVARAAYAVSRGLVPADRILLLAFNRAAARELQERVETRLSAAGIDPTGVRASTFHAFGLQVIGRATGRKPRLASWLDDGGDVGMVSRIVDELRDRSPGFRFQWDLYRLLFARMADAPEGGDADGYDPGSRTTGFRTFRGETVKSQGERLIADFLFLNGVGYEYERPYVHDVADPQHSQYRPDFYYPDADLWHEHWALDREGRAPSAFRGYQAGIDWKRATHRRFGTDLVETTWAGILDGDGFAPFAQELARHGLELDWNPDRPVPGAAPVRHEDLARLMRSFMTHVKAGSLTREDLEERLATAPASVQRYRARIFLDLFWAIHDEWQRRLRADDAIDFEDMLVLAADHLESGRVDMGVDLVLVDEFQDASRARARMTRALVSAPHRYLLAVGDDWQSVNRFAGADLSVMTRFTEWFGEGPVLRLQTTFRCSQTICDTAGGFVAKNPRQLAKVVRSVHADGPQVALVRVAKPTEVQAAVAAVLADVAERLGEDDPRPRDGGRPTVDVLGRYSFDRDLLPAQVPPDLQVSFRTVHSAKGLEADVVVLPNMTSGTYGFPSQVVDDPVLSLAMSESDPFPFAEERRLFYVALTRARREVTLVTVRGRESPFVAELLAAGRLEVSPLSTVDDSPPCPRCGRGFLVHRHRKADGAGFLGCSTFPRCRFTRPT